MGWTVLPYSLATGGSVTDADMTATTDPEFTTRNSHIILTEQYKLGALYGAGATITRLNLSLPKYNAISKFNVWPLNISSANVPSPPRLAWLYPNAPDLSKNEELAFKVTDGASENALAAALLMTPGHNANLPSGQLLIPLRCTASVTQVAAGWSALAALTFEQSPRGGVYAIISAEVVCAASHWFRLVFPRTPWYNGRKLRPGWLVQQAIGDLPEPKLQINPYAMGVWGYFHTFESPQIEVWSAAATSTVTAEIRLWCQYLGESLSLLDGPIQAGWQ